MESSYPEVKRIMLVSHAATVIALGRALCRDRGMQIRAGTCSLSRYDRVMMDGSDESTEARKSDSGYIGKWNCTLNGWTGHLEKGEQVSMSLYFIQNHPKSSDKSLFHNVKQQRHWDFEGEIEMEEDGQGEGVMQGHEEEKNDDDDDEAKAKL